MKKRFSVIAVMVAMVWGGSASAAYSVDIVGEQVQKAPVTQAAWFQARPKSFADLAEKVQDAVVNISTSKKLTMRRPMMPISSWWTGSPASISLAASPGTVGGVNLGARSGDSICFAFPGGYLARCRPGMHRLQQTARGKVTGRSRKHRPKVPS